MEDKYDFYNGEKIVLTGVSAGGIAAFMWSNYLMERTIKAKVYSIPDSGFFLTDYYSPIWKAKILREQAQVIMNIILQPEYFSLP